MEHEDTDTPIDAGGGGAIDPSDPKDRAMLRRYMTRNPARYKGIDDAKRTFWLDATHAAIRRSHLKAERYEQELDEGPAFDGDKAADEKSRLWTKLVLDGVKTAVMMDHLNAEAEERARIEAGGLTGRVEHTGTVDLDVLVRQRPELRPAIEAMAEEAARRMLDGTTTEGP